ncbi:MAG: TIGR04372 family glycosyltransferase [Cyanobacteria bacterium P01_A01_bin.123]
MYKIIHKFRQKGWSGLRNKVLRSFLALLNASWCIPGVLLIRFLRPWYVIRLGTIRSDRIGHFTADTCIRWATLHQQAKEYLDLYWLDQPTCNDFWAKMVRRNFAVYPWVQPLSEWNQILPGGSIHYRPSTTTDSLDIYGFLERNKAKLPFLPEEDIKAKDWLSKLGWRVGEPFICLNVRDNAYLDADPLLKGSNWSYHDYRNSNIETYVPAAEWLAERGVWVLRMGKIMAQPIPSDHPRIIDYAFLPDRSDFLDIWLFANCDLCISTGSGPDTISSSYRKPILFLNFLPLSRLWSWSNAMHLSKSLTWKSSGISLTWREYLAHSYFHTNNYDHADIEIIDLTPEEILAAVQERWQRIQGTWVDTEDDLRRNLQFWEILKSHPDFHKYHGWIHPEARAGATWLRSMGDKFLA